MTPISIHCCHSPTCRDLHCPGRPNTTRSPAMPITKHPGTNTISLADWRAQRRGQPCAVICLAAHEGGPTHTCQTGECVKAAADAAVDKVRAHHPHHQPRRHAPDLFTA